MSAIHKIRAAVARACIRAGRVCTVFVIALLLLALLALAGHYGLFFVLDVLIASVTGIWLCVRLLRYLLRRSLWSLRNRLLMVYALIGILPIALILMLVGLSAYALTSELAIFLATSALDRRVDSIRSAAESLAGIPLAQRPYASRDIVEYYSRRFPGFALYTSDSTGQHRYPAAAAAFSLPTGWKPASGLLRYDGKFYGWDFLASGDGSVIAMAPLSNDQLANLVPNLGEILLIEPKNAAGMPVGSPVDIKLNPSVSLVSPSANMQSASQPAGAPVSVQQAGNIPPPVNRFDIAVQWVAEQAHLDYDRPNGAHTAVLVVRTRPSAVFAAIFAGNDMLRGVLLGALVGIAILFLVVEIVALVIGVSLSRRITRAVHEMYEGTRRVIFGDFHHRIPIRSRDQLGELTTSFNQMTGNLQRLLSVEKEKERMQSELEIAREVQAQLYPKIMPQVRGLRLTVNCEPARMVSGDYYDYQSVREEKLAFAIGDVAGKGISAALLMATLQAAMRAQITACVERIQSPGAPDSLGAAHLVSDLNKQVYAHSAPEKYATFFFAIYDELSGVLTYTNAGHLPPILIRNGDARLLDINGTVVGAFPFSIYDESRVKLEPGDILVCYTDGITEPENAYEEMFGEDRLIEIVKRSIHEDDLVIAQNIIDAVRNWHSAPELPDDMTVLIARRLECV